MAFNIGPNNIKYKEYQGVTLFENLIKEQLLTVKELAQFLNLSEKTLRGWVYKQLVPFVKVRRTVRFSAAAIEKWIAEGTYGNTNT